VVVDLTVADDPCRAVTVGQRLPAAADVDDGESLVAQPGRVERQYPGVIRSPMLYPVEHPFALAGVNLTEGRDDPAHGGITYPVSH
jgi:hypothetical protein